MDVETRNVVTLPIGYYDDGQLRNLGCQRSAGRLCRFERRRDFDPVDQNGGRAEVYRKRKYAGHRYRLRFDEPVDRRIDQQHYDEYLANDGVRPGYRTVHLQRLANPLLAFNAQSNPYRTVDTNTIDLVVFNGAETIADPNNTPTMMRFGTHERQSADRRGRRDIPAKRRLLFQHDRRRPGPR